MSSSDKIDQESLRRIIQIISVLGSDSDGEVLAATRAIRRVLAACNCTFGDLKTVLSIALDPETAFTLSQVDLVRRCAEELIDNTEFMKEHEARFVHHMATRLAADPGFEMSEKQAAWFAALHAKYAV